MRAGFSLTLKMPGRLQPMTCMGKGEHDCLERILGILIVRMQQIHCNRDLTHAVRNCDERRTVRQLRGGRSTCEHFRMMTLCSNLWQRRGVSLLFDAQALAAIAQPHEVLSIDDFLGAMQAPPSAGPGDGNRALVVTGLDARLEEMAPEACDPWLETLVVPAVSRFRSTRGDRAALVFWVSGGRARFYVDDLSGACTWSVARSVPGRPLDVASTLFGDAPCCLARILDPRAADLHPDGPAWIGLHFMSPA